MRIIFKSILGALAICLGTYLSGTVNNQYISPLIFSVGILLVISLNLDLTTRTIPTEMKWDKALIVLSANLITSVLIGLLFQGYKIPPINTRFRDAIIAGLVIGLVSLVNGKQSLKYKTVVTLMLMYAFVWLKLPHCVVYAFYMGVDIEYWEFLPRVIAGNVIGGVLIGLLAIAYRRINKIEDKTRGSKEKARQSKIHALHNENNVIGIK